MIQYNSRIDATNNIKFYERDLLYDDYEYSNNITVDLNIEYINPGFGIVLIDNENNNIVDAKALIFKLGSNTFEIIQKDEYNNLTYLFDTQVSNAHCYTENLRFKVEKRKNIYNFIIGEREISNIVLPYNVENFYLGYYSSKDNVIKDINIASNIPYNWIVNMSNTKGGYITFNRDGFELLECKEQAEIEQINIELQTGTYYLKYDSEDSDIVPYVFNSQDQRLSDKEKNILNSNNFFTIIKNQNVSLKFVGTHGKVKNITITSEQDNEYLRTSITNTYRQVDESYINILLPNINSFEFFGTILKVPGINHFSPEAYSILNVNDTSYGLFDLSLSENVEYKFSYKDGLVIIENGNGKTINKISTNVSSILKIFNNVNGIIHDLVIVDKENNQYNYGIQNTVTKYVPRLIKSPIVVLNKNRDDENSMPLDLSSSYRVIKKEPNNYYMFTNVEREYFDIKEIITLDKVPSNERNSVKLYFISKYAKYDLDKLLDIPYKGNDTLMDTIDEFCDGQYTTITEDVFDHYGICIYRDLREINLTACIERLSDYCMVVVDYLKAESYCVNYDYERRAYRVDISTDSESVDVLYDNIEHKVVNYEYINEQQYVDSGIIPTKNCYIVIGK